jgi:hypothetical protein
MKHSMWPTGPPIRVVSVRPNSFTADTTASNADVARRSCSSAPLIPDVGISRAACQASSPTLLSLPPPFEPVGYLTWGEEDGAALGDDFVITDEEAVVTVKDEEGLVFPSARGVAARRQRLSGWIPAACTCRWSDRTARAGRTMTLASASVRPCPCRLRVAFDPP